MRGMSCGWFVERMESEEIGIRGRWSLGHGWQEGGRRLAGCQQVDREDEIVLEILALAPCDVVHKVSEVQEDRRFLVVPVLDRSRHHSRLQEGPLLVEM